MFIHVVGLKEGRGKIYKGNFSKYSWSNSLSLSSNNKQHASLLNILMNLGLYQRIRRTDRISPLFRISGYSVKYMIAYNADSGKTTNIYTYIKTLIMTYCQRWKKKWWTSWFSDDYVELSLICSTKPLFSNCFKA